MDIFRTVGSGSLSVTAMLNFLGTANTLIHGLGEDATAIPRRPGGPVSILSGSMATYFMVGAVQCPSNDGSTSQNVVLTP